MLTKLLNKALSVGFIRNYIIKLHHAKRLKSFNQAKQAALNIKNNTGKKTMVFLVNSEYEPVTKQNIKAAKRAGAFKKIKVDQIEKHAMFIAK